MGRKFWLEKGGNVAIVTAIASPLLLGAAGLGVEVGMWRYDQVRLQQAADAAAYTSAVVTRAGNGDPSAAASAVTATNGFGGAADTVTLASPSPATPSDPNSIQALLTHTEPQLFSSFFHTTPAVIRARATASYTNASDACILALSKSAAKALDFAGSSVLTVSGCSALSNSIAINSVNIQGSAQVTAPCLYSVGGANLGGTLNLTSCTSVHTNQPPIGDPYKNLAMPPVTGPCQNDPGGGGSISPGHYCKLSLKNSQTLSPGIYVIDGGSLSVNANASVVGSGVTFYLMNGASVSMNGNADVQLSAPTSGTYSGFLFISDRANTGTISINGDSTSQTTGIIYSPAGLVSYIGNFSGAGGCTQIVASIIQWSGNASFSDNCSNSGMGKAQIPSLVRVTS